MKERLVQFDILKGIGILCVLLGHTVLSGFPREFIYGFHMPLFFFCSGVFFKNRCLRQVLSNNLLQLLVPYIFFLLVLNGSYFLTNLYASKSISVAVSDVINGLDMMDENSKLFLSIWFLPCLFFVRFLYAIIQKLTENKYLNLLIGSCLYIIGNHSLFPFFLDTTLSVYIFYALGHLFFISGIYKKNISLVIPILLLSLYAAFIAMVHPVVDIKYNVFPWYLIFLSVAVIYAFYQICLYLTIYSNMMIHFLADCGRKSITLFGLHRPLWLFVYPICIKLQVGIPFVLVAVEMLSALVIILPIHNLINRYAPYLIGQKGK